MPPILHTARLTLRPPIEEDFEGFAALASDGENMRFIGGYQPRPVAWRGFASLLGHWQLRGYGMFSFIETKTGRWIGRGGPWNPEGWPAPEVGWALLRDVQGQGYAIEAAEAAIGWAFDTLRWDMVHHCIDPLNVPSIKVAERLGSRRLREGMMPPPIDHMIDLYGQSRAEWQDKRAGGMLA